MTSIEHSCDPSRSGDFLVSDGKELKCSVLTHFPLTSCYIFQVRLFGLNNGGALSTPSLQFKLLGWLEPRTLQEFTPMASYPREEREEMTVQMKGKKKEKCGTALKGHFHHRKSKTPQIGNTTTALTFSEMEGLGNFSCLNIAVSLLRLRCTIA